MYSQNDEEKYILEACKSSTVRRVLDIGAWDPKDKSNSRALIELGWSAILIEPSPGPVRNLVVEYADTPTVTVVCGAVGFERGMAQILITDDAVSSTQNQTVETWKERGGYIGRMLIPTITIGDILTRWGSFDMVSIDTEGTSVDLLHVLLATEMFPRCICVEHDGRAVEAQMAAQKRGYKQVYASAENLVFSL